MLIPVNFLKGVSVPQISKDFEFTINTANVSTGSTANNQFKIPLISGVSVDFTVYWGDGTSSYIGTSTSPLLTHTYSIPGIYNVVVKGTIRGLRFNNTGDRSKLLNISNFGTKFYITGSTSITIGGAFFRGCNNLTITATDAPIIETPNLHGMFVSCTSLIDPDFSSWNISTVNRTSAMFSGCYNFNGNISNWNTSNVTNMSAMFFSCASFNRDISTWNVSNVTNMDQMFRNASIFNQNINNWNVSNVIIMSRVFNNTISFNQPLDNWNVSNVITTNNMFAYATSFNQPLNSWNTGNILDMISMFQGATSFNQPLNNWNVSSVNNMRAMFSGATSFNQPLNNWDTSNVEYMESIFESATAFNQNIGNWNVTSVIYDEVNYFSQSFFLNATSFNNGGSPDIGNWNLASLKVYDYIFSGATSFNQPLTNWNFNEKWAADYMFSGATSFNQDISNLVPYNSDYGEFYMYDFLEGATSFTSANLDAYYNGCLNYYVTNGLSMSYVEFSAGTIKYTSASSAARASLIANYGWIIIDGGPA